MFLKTKALMLTGLLLGFLCTPAKAAEPGKVRVVMDLVTGVQKAKTGRVWLERQDATIGCVHDDEERYRWCYEVHPSADARRGMLRIRYESLAGIQVGQIYAYVDDVDLDGLVDVGNVKRIEGPPNAPLAVDLPNSFQRRTGRGEEYRADFQKLYDAGIDIAIKYFGE